MSVRELVDPRPGLHAIQATNQAVEHGIEPWSLDVQDLVDLRWAYSFFAGAGEVPIQRSCLVEEATSTRWVRAGQPSLTADAAPGRVSSPFEKVRAFLSTNSRADDPGTRYLSLGENCRIAATSKVIFA